MKLKLSMIMITDEEAKKLGEEGHQLIYDVCHVAEFRLPGSEGEEKGQKFLAKKMKEDFGADEVITQEFSVYPRFFRWWPILSLGFYLLSLIVFHWSPLLSALLIVFMLGNVALKLLSFQFLDLLFKKQNSTNVIGKLKPKSVLDGNRDKSKRILLFGGHTDSTYEFPLGRKYQMKMVYFYVTVLVLAGLWMLTSIILAIVRAVNDVPQFMWNTDLSWYYILFLVLTPIVAWIVTNIVSGRPVPGANDNLSGVAVTTAVMKYFSKNRPENVELWSVCFGSEEGGMKGSKFLSSQVQSQLES